MREIDPVGSGQQTKFFYGGSVECASAYQSSAEGSESQSDVNDGDAAPEAPPDDDPPWWEQLDERFVGKGTETANDLTNENNAPGVS